MPHQPVLQRLPVALHFLVVEIEDAGAAAAAAAGVVVGPVGRQRAGIVVGVVGSEGGHSERAKTYSNGQYTLDAPTLPVTPRARRPVTAVSRA